MDDSTLVNLSDLEEELEENMPRRLKSYSNKFKLKVVSHAKRVSKKSASETHHVDRRHQKKHHVDRQDACNRYAHC